MVMELYFSNQEELYKRLLPALRIKKKEFKKTIPNIDNKKISTSFNFFILSLFITI